MGHSEPGGGGAGSGAHPGLQRVPGYLFMQRFCPLNLTCPFFIGSLTKSESIAPKIFIDESHNHRKENKSHEHFIQSKTNVIEK